MNKFLLFLFLSVFSQTLFSQIIPANDPNMSINWDWTKSQEQYIYFKNAKGQIQPPLTNVFLPFYSSSTPLNSSGDPQKADMHPEDGWLLICRDFGTPQRAPYVPFFALYNKYTGTLRVMFLNPASLNGLNGYSNFKAQLEWLHQDATGAIMTFTPTQECFVNEYSKTHNEFSVSTVENTPESWGYADFHLTGYEPSFAKTKNAFFKISLIAVDISKIKLNSTQLSLNQIINKNENISGSILDKITSGSGGDFSKSVSQSTKYYKATDDGKKQLAKWIDYDYIKGEIPETYKLQYQTDYWNDYYLKDNNIIKKEWYQKASTWIIDNLGKSAPYVAGVIGFVTSYFGGKDKAAAQEPINFSGTLNFEGSIENMDNISSFAIALSPLNEYTGQEAYWPIQTIPWGIFNIVEKPVVELGFYVQELQEVFYNYGVRLYCLTYFARLKNLKYVFNDNSELELINMKTAFVYDDSKPTSGYLNPVLLQNLKSFAYREIQGSDYLQSPSNRAPTGLAVHCEYKVKSQDVINSPTIYQMDKVYPITVSILGNVTSKIDIDNFPYLYNGLENSVSLTTNPYTNDFVVAANKITAQSYIIKAGENDVFLSGEEIILKDGFKAENGSMFTAKVPPISENRLKTAKVNGSHIAEVDKLFGAYYNVEDVDFHQLKITGDILPVFIPYNGSGDNYVDSSLISIGVNDDIIVFPNPNDGVFTIQQPFDNVSVKIVNNIGQIIYTNNHDLKHISIDISSVPSGVYFIEIKSIGAIYRKKIVIQ